MTTRVPRLALTIAPSIVPVLAAVVLGGLITTPDAHAQPDAAALETAPADTSGLYEVDGIVVSRTRADRTYSAVPFTEIDNEEIQSVSVGQDVPMVLRYLPSTYAYSDAGNDFGYSYLSIRGFTQDRVGMLINGVPINDPESHQVYWVDHGDILSGSSSVQVQRGVGTTLYGTTSFGGSVNVQTSPLGVKPGLHLFTGYADFTQRNLTSPTRLYRVAFSSGPIMDGRVALYGRYSRQNSDGYRVASGANLETYTLSGLYSSERVRHKLDVIVGQQTSQAAWDGISPMLGPSWLGDDASRPPFNLDLRDRDQRRYNVYSGYQNESDNFHQVIASLTSEYFTDSDISLSNTLYYVEGDGFFEQFREDDDLYTYGLFDEPDSLSTDVVRRRWLVNSYFGILPQVRMPVGEGRFTAGLGLRYYEARHFGEVIWTQADLPVRPLDRYYDHDTSKISWEAYARLDYPLASRTNLSAAIQYQGHRYEVEQGVVGNFVGWQYRSDYDFISPRIGIRQGIGDAVSLFGSVSYAQREPSSNDYIDEDDPLAVPAFEGADPETNTTGLTETILKPETVVDLELGLEYVRNSWRTRVTAYHLEFRDQLIPIEGGRIEEEGRLQRANADRTRHQGLELEARWTPGGGLDLGANLSLSRHRFIDHEIYAYWLDDYAGGLLRYDGNDIPRSPRVLCNVLADYRWGAMLLGGNVIIAGKQYIEGENLEDLAIEGFAVLNLRAGFDIAKAMGSSRRVELEFRVNNVLDTLYETFGYSYYDDFPARPLGFYWPAATRSVYGGLHVNL